MTPRQMESLERLQSLRDVGTLDDAEFERQKDKILRGKSWPILIGTTFAVTAVAITAGTFGGFHVPDGIKGLSALQSFETNASPLATNGPENFSFHSHVKGAALAQMLSLSNVPAHAPDPQDCTECFVAAQTLGGRLAELKGWHVVREAKLGALDAVLIVSHMVRQTSARVEPEDDKVALFNGERLVGMLSGKGMRSIEIGSLEPVQGALRVWSAIPETLQGQLSFKGKAVRFDKVTGSDPVCDGAHRVPAIFGDNYSRARLSLQRAGWQPEPQAKDLAEIGSWSPEARYGEADECSGMGWGRCSFDYKAAKGPASLTVITYGDETPDAPVVSSYSVNCAGKVDN